MPGLTPIKLNMVILDGVNDSEIEDFLAYVRGNRNLVLRSIELMHFNDCTYHGDLNVLEDSLASALKTDYYEKDASPEKILSGRCGS